MRYVITRTLAAGELALLIVGSVLPADTEQIQPAYLFGEFVLHVFGNFELNGLVVLSHRGYKLEFSAIAAVLIGLVL